VARVTWANKSAFSGINGLSQKPAILNMNKAGFMRYETMRLYSHVEKSIPPEHRREPPY
jgi:hypothetical protein